jgi:dTDP-4-dehydrorhamnose 3,5-epimerase
MKEQGTTVSRPRLLAGNLAVDDRGEVGFVNDFHFDGVKRFYTVSNFRQGFVRAWHAHQREAKFITAVQGSALMGTVRVDNWEKPSPEAEVATFVLSAHKPAVLCVPPGHANGFMSLTSDLKLMIFSTTTLEESQGDDFRYDARHWDIWKVAPR